MMNRIDEWTMPPECAGQIVERMYRYDADTDRVWERTHDRSNGEVSYRSAATPEDYDCEFQNGAPHIRGWRNESSKG